MSGRRGVGRRSEQLLRTLWGACFSSDPRECAGQWAMFRSLLKGVVRFLSTRVAPGAERKVKTQHRKASGSGSQKNQAPPKNPAAVLGHDLTDRAPSRA